MDQENNNNGANKTTDDKPAAAPLSLEPEKKPEAVKLQAKVPPQQPAAQQAPAVAPPQAPAQQQVPPTPTQQSQAPIQQTPAAPAKPTGGVVPTPQTSKTADIPLAPPLGEKATQPQDGTAPLAPPKKTSEPTVASASDNPSGIKDEDAGKVMPPPSGVAGNLKKPVGGKGAILGGIVILAGLAAGSYFMFFAKDEAPKNVAQVKTSVPAPENTDWQSDLPPQPAPMEMASADIVQSEPDMPMLDTPDELIEMPTPEMGADLAELHQESLGMMEEGAAVTSELEPAPTLEAPDQLGATPDVNDLTSEVEKIAAATDPTDPKLSALIEEPSAAELALVNNAETLMQMAEGETQMEKTGHTPAPSSQSVEDLINALDEEAGMPMVDAADSMQVAVDQGPKSSGVDAVVRPLPKKFLILKKSAKPETKDAKVFAAQRALSEGRYQASYEMFERLGSKYKKDKRVLMGKALSLQKMGHNERALDAYEDVLTRQPKNLDALTNMLGLLRSQEPGLALEKLIELYEIYPTNEAVLAQLGSTYGYLGKYEEGVRYLDIALTLDHENISYHYNRAVLLDHLGQRRQAAEAYSKVLNMSSTTPKLKGAVPLDSIRARLRDIQ